MSRNPLARLGIAVAAGLLAAGALAAPASAAAPGTIQGTFTDPDHNPIAGATVTAYSGVEDQLGDTTTDAAGHYTLRGVDSGEIKLQFDDNGLVQWSAGRRDSETATVYQLPAGGTLTVNEQQAATGVISGQFTDAAGQPVYANVLAQGIDYWSYLYSYTDETGAYQIKALPGTYQVSFQWGSATQYAFGTPDQQAAATITVTAGQTTTVDDHKLPTGTIGGHLAAADGTPLVSASVTLHHDDNSIGYASTDENGDYSFGEVLTGSGYTVSFSTGPADQYVPGTLDPAKARQFTVAEGEQITVDDTQLTTAVVHGRLVDSDGSPKSGYTVNVTLDDDNNWINYDTTTDADGRWSVSGVYPGDYRVSFVTPDWERTQWAYGAGTEAAAKLITVEAGSSVAVDDTWLPGATLVVNAVDAATGAPVSNYCVWVDSPGDGTGCTTGSQVTVSDLPGGDFRLEVSPDQSSYYLWHNGTPVTLASGQTTTVTVPLILGGKVAVAATDHATGLAVKDTCPIFKVLGTGGLGDGYGDCTDTTGKATSTSMAPGTYEVFAVAPGGYGHQWVGKTGGTGNQRAAARVVVKPGTTVPAPAVRLDKAGTITGVVTGTDGAAMAFVDVAFSAWGFGPGPGWDTATGSGGRYTLGKLGPYSWPLLFTAGGGYPRQWSGNVANRFKATGVPVNAGATSTYDVKLTKTSTLKGTVTVPSAPAASWRINAFTAATGDEMGVFDSTAAGPGGAYAMPLAGGQQVKIAWSYYLDGADADGWYDHAADMTTAKKVGIPAAGTRKLNLTIG